MMPSLKPGNKAKREDKKLMVLNMRMKMLTILDLTSYC